MAEISEQALREVREAIDRYRERVRATSMTESTKQTYILHADNFVRWLGGDFDPGGRVSAER